MFRAIPSSGAILLKPEAESVERTPGMCRCVDEERGLLDPLFLAEFPEERRNESCRSCPEQPRTYYLIRSGLDGVRKSEALSSCEKTRRAFAPLYSPSEQLYRTEDGVRPVVLVVDQHHRLVDRDLIRNCIVGGL